MLNITFVTPDGIQHSVTAEVGTTLMEAARNSDIPGIEAECGGACACATCHVYVCEEWLATTGLAQAEERELLGFVDEPRPESRLSCQITLSNAMDGLLVELPAD